MQSVKLIAVTRELTMVMQISPRESVDAVNVASSDDYWMIFASLMFTFVALNIGLYFFVLDAFAYDFLERNWLSGDPSTASITIAVAMAVLVSHAAALTRRKPSDFFLLILAVCPIFPMLALYGYRGAASDFIVVSLFCYFIIFFVIRARGDFLVQYAGAKIDPEKLIKFGFILLGLFIFLSVASGNLAALNFSIDDVYQYRRAAAGYRSVGLSYLLTNLMGMIVPLVIALLLARKRYLPAIGCFFAVFIVFGLTSHRSHLFIPLLVAFVFIALRKDPSGKLVILGLGAGVVGSTMLFQLSDDLATFGTLLVRRIFYVPAYLNYLYFEYFSLNPHMYWADSRISIGLINNPYGIPAPQVIMNHYTGVDFSTRVDEYGNANTGFLGAGYANAGYLGMIIYSLIIAVYMRLGDVIGEKLGYVTASASLCPFFMLIVFSSSDTITSFISYGGLLLVTLALVLKPHRSIKLRGKGVRRLGAGTQAY